MSTTMLDPCAGGVPVAPSSGRRPIARILLSTVGFLIAAGLVFWLARTAGPSWLAVRASLGQVGLLDLGALTAVWAFGLWCHSWVLTAALPGLSRRRALLLNLSGSAVSDLIPFGAAAGAGLNLAMVRSWNFDLTRYGSFTAIHNLWNVMAKLGLPTIVLVFALLGGTIRSPGLVVTAEAALAATAALGLVAVAAISSRRAAELVGRAADRLFGWGARLAGSSRTSRLAQTLPSVRAETAAVIRRGWPQLTAGVSSYLALQAVLWWMCLQVIGAGGSLNVVLAGFAVERVLSMLPFTPGGAGLAEAGSIAVLVSLGGDPVTTTAGVLLYRGFAFLLEIPVGGAGLLAWCWTQRRRPAAGAVA
jgi:uncharacterized membrane protein YbhN (UPF0104 family)